MSGVLCSMVGASFASAGPDYGITGGVAFDAGEYYRDTSITSSYSDTKNMTISYWFKKNSFAARSFIWSVEHTIGRRYIAVLNTNGSVRYYVQTASSTSDRTTTETSLFTTGTWNHAVASFNFTTGAAKVYVNGVAVTLATATFTENLEFSNIEIVDLNNSRGGDSVGNSIAQFYWSNTFQDLDTLSVRQRFYNAGWVNMGTNGTLSGADSPMLFHIGDLSTTPAFTTNGGGLTGISYTAVGTPSSTAGPV
jgi:hypothetical protein